MQRRLISVPFLLLRGTTAGAAFVTGLVQTFVFAHVLSPERFSIFILVAAVGYSLWLIDFGIVKILFVRLRAHFLAGQSDTATAGHATAVVLFYLALRKAGVPAEIHIYERGGHGAGLGQNDEALSSWPQRLADWLRIRGLLNAAPR